MAEPWTDTKSYITGDGQFLRLLTALTFDSTVTTKITGLGTTKIDLLATVSAATPTYAGAASTDTKYFETKLSTGNILRVQDNTITMEGATGYKATSDGKTVDGIDVTATMGITNYSALLTLFRAGTPIAAARAIGFKADDGTCVGYEHIIGKITEFSAAPKEGLMEVKFKISAGKTYTADTGVTYSAYNTQMTGSSNKITPVGMGELTITDLTADNFTSLLTGAIVQTT